jgi:hypothetical protein
LLRTGKSKVSAASVGEDKAYREDGEKKKEKGRRERETRNRRLGRRRESKLIFFLVGDFGLSKFLEEHQTNHTLTACGTPIFAAPEVLLQEKYSFKADVYRYANPHQPFFLHLATPPSSLPLLSISPF